MQTRAEARASAERGLAWLMEHGGRFNLDVDRVDVNRLDIRNGDRCVLGQAGATHYGWVMERLAVYGLREVATATRQHDWAVAHGFMAPGLPEGMVVFYAESDQLTAVWRELLTEHRTRVGELL